MIVLTQKPKPGYKLIKSLFGKYVEIPDYWNWDKLEKNSTVKGRIGWQGLTTAEYREIGEYHLVTGTDFKKGRINWKNCAYVEAERFIQDEHIQLKKEDVLVTKDGTIGKIAYIDTLPKHATLNSGIFVIRPLDKKYLPIFLFYILNSSYFDKFLNRLKAGSTISHLYQKDFINFYFPIPQIQEQKKITSLLISVDELITKYDEIIYSTKSLKQGLMQTLLMKGIGQEKFKKVKWLFGKYIEIPEVWDLKKIKEIAKVSVGLVINPSTYFDDNGTVPMITGKHVTENGIVLDNVDFITEKNNKLLGTTRIWSGDLVTMRVGYPGRTSVVKNEHDGINCASVIITRRSKKYISQFLCYLANSKLMSKQIMMYQAGGAQQVVNIGSWKEFLIPFPPIQEQQKIVSMLSKIDSKIHELTSKKSNLEKLKKGLMQKLLTGQIRVKI